MFVYLSHVLDPVDLVWSSEPTVKVARCTDVSAETPFSSFLTTLPNHCGTHQVLPAA